MVETITLVAQRYNKTKANLRGRLRHVQKHLNLSYLYYLGVRHDIKLDRFLRNGHLFGIIVVLSSIIISFGDLMGIMHYLTDIFHRLWFELLFFIAIAILPVNAFGATIYTYEGNRYDFLSPSPIVYYNTSMSVAGSMTTSGPLQPSIIYNNTSNPLPPTVFNFFDGIITYDANDLRSYVIVTIAVEELEYGTLNLENISMQLMTRC